MENNLDDQVQGRRGSTGVTRVNKSVSYHGHAAWQTAGKSDGSAPSGRAPRTGAGRHL